MQIKVIDCFIFYNELDLLLYRLNILNDVVDYFVIVEATHTFTGNEKKLFFNENKHLFEQFTQKIIHIVVDDFPYKHPNFNKNEQWANEIFQRNAIKRGINYITSLSPSDVITITDLDEIPDPQMLNEIKMGNTIIDVKSLMMDFYYYNLNTKFSNKWYSSKIISYAKYIELNLTCEQIRHLPYLPYIVNGGWHLSYFGDVNFIQNKLHHFSHQEYNNPNYTSPSYIEECVNIHKSLFDKDPILPTKIIDNTYLPVHYDKYLRKYYST
jgi:beta-1,4-mannosyl-glycoprotein beta-1,4-N-acetylglucosaminyltransferase